MTRAVCLSVLISAMATPALAQSGSCKPVFDAMLKETTTPHHVVTTKDGAPAGEAIATADETFVKVKGAWRRSPITPQQTLAQQQENIRDTTVQTCTPLPDEVVDGTPAKVYHAHYEQKDLGISEAKVWIAKATGLPVRTDVSIQAGEKTSISTKFDYTDIKAPIVK